MKEVVVQHYTHQSGPIKFACLTITWGFRGKYCKVSPAAPACHCWQKQNLSAGTESSFIFSIYQNIKLGIYLCVVKTHSPLERVVQQRFPRKIKTHTDLKGIFSVDVVVHRQHWDVEAGQQNAAKYPLLFLICTGKQNKSTCCNHASQSHAHDGL